MKRISSIWIAILGIVVGALIVLAYNAYNQKRNMLRVQYGDWRKLNLILDQIDKNYVDTINVGKVTDAAITAVEIDDHAIIEVEGYLLIGNDIETVVVLTAFTIETLLPTYNSFRE